MAQVFPLLTKAALQQAKNCSATLKKLRCRKVALSCGFQAPTLRHPRLGPAEGLPKGPIRTKSTTATQKIVNYYAAMFLLRRPMFLLRHGPFSE